MRDEAFRILIAVHRPRYRSRAERAAAVPGWLARSLLNKEDPIGLLNKKPPFLVFVVSDDFGRQKDMGILKAAQRFRQAGLRVVGVFRDQESADAAPGLCDQMLAPPWRTSDLQEVLARFCLELTGKPANAPNLPEEPDTSGGCD